MYFYVIFMLKFKDGGIMADKQPKNYARRTAKYFNFWRKVFQNIVCKKIKVPLVEV